MNCRKIVNELTDSLRVASDNVIAAGLDLINSRKDLFADALRRGNELLEAQYFPSTSSINLWHNDEMFEIANWQELINSSPLCN